MRYLLLSLGLLIPVGCNQPQPPSDNAADSSRVSDEPAPPPPENDRDLTDTTRSDSLDVPDKSDASEPPEGQATIQPTEPEADTLTTEPDGPHSPGGIAGSCDVRSTEQFCFAYTGEHWTAASAQDHCGKAPESAFSERACPAEGRIATCAFERGGDPAQEITYTYYEPFDPALAEIACPGEFTLLD